MQVENLPKSLKIESECLVTCLNSIKQEVKKLWDSPLLQHYTHHGLDHSKRIIEILGNLLEKYPDLLNEHERFIILASAYLHDIGMQSPPHAGLPFKSTYTLKELEKIREKHNEASAKMISESVSKRSKLSLGLEQCKDYIDFIATLSRYHRKLDINEIEDTALAGKDIRLVLLIALLRLSDELDQDYRRVNMEILKLRDIPVQSKFYWWSHHYVSSILIRKGKIALYFRFPKKYQGDKITETFRDKVHESVNGQFLEVYYILDKYGVRLYRDVIIEEEKYVPEGVLELVPDDLLKYINENILKTKDSSQKLSIRTGVTWFVDGVPYSDDAEVVKCLANVFKLMDEERHSEAVKEIKKCWTLTMAPKEKMILSVIASNCYYILGKLAQAKNYCEGALKISKRKDLQEIYKEQVILARAATLGNIGIIYSDEGDLANALKYFQEVLKINRKVGYKQGEAIQLNNIGVVYKSKGDLANALKYFQEALKINREISYKQGEAINLGNIGNTYRDKSDLEKALKYHQEALKINSEVDYKLGEASQLGNIGITYRDKGDLEKALKYHQEALKINREVGYKQGEGNQLGNIGLIYRDKGDLENALKYFQEGLKIHKEIDYKQGEASYLGNIGLIYSDKGDLERALKCFQESLEINKEVGYKQGEAMQLSNIGTIYREKGMLGRALECFQEALNLDRKIGYKRGEANNLSNIGVIYSHKDDSDKALRYFQEALRIDKEVGYKQGEASDLGNIGFIYRDKGDLERALKYQQEALKLDREVGYKQGEGNDLGNIGLIYRDKGDLENALKYLQEALEIFNIAAPQLTVKTLNNIAVAYFKKQSYKKGFEYSARAISSSSSLEQFNKALSLLLRTVRELIMHNEWNNLEKIHSTYTSGIITDKIWLNFFMAIHEYALYKKTRDDSHTKKYRSAQRKLNPALKKLLSELLEVGK